jgi:signal peptidase I
MAGGIAAVSLTVLFVLAACTMLKQYRIPTSAMEPALHCAAPAPGCEGDANDRILVRRFLPGEDPGRGDVIVFEGPDEMLVQCGARGTFVKRVIGLPGELVRQREGAIVVDGRPLDEPYARRDGESGRWRVPEGEYFVLGDNRPNSCDSRRWGGVPRDDVIGKVVVRYWPPGRIGRLP